MADELREWKPRNRLANALAGGLKSVNAFAAKPFGYDNPPGEMLVNALALPQIASTLERYSYGQPLTNAGKANVPMLPSDTADALMAAAPVVAKWPKQAAGAALGLAGIADTGAGKAMFIGAKAHTWDKAAAAKAAKLEQSGVDARTIWQETGTFKGADGMWRQEIDDSVAAFNDAGFKPFSGRLTSKNVTLNKQINHQGLFSAYPTLGKVDAVIDRGLPGSAGGGSGSFGGGLLQAQGPNDSETLGTALHEIQHGIQGAERFAGGGNRNSTPLLKEFNPEVEQILSESGYKKTKAGWVNGDGEKLPPWLGRAVEESAAKNLYTRLAGEAEARAVESRMNLTPAERRAKFPYDSYDVPVNSLIVRR